MEGRDVAAAAACANSECDQKLYSTCLEQRWGDSTENSGDPTETTCCQYKGTGIGNIDSSPELAPEQGGDCSNPYTKFRNTTEEIINEDRMVYLRTIGAAVEESTSENAGTSIGIRTDENTFWNTFTIVKGDGATPIVDNSHLMPLHPSSTQAKRRYFEIKDVENLQGLDEAIFSIGTQQPRTSDQGGMMALDYMFLKQFDLTEQQTEIKFANWTRLSEDTDSPGIYSAQLPLRQNLPEKMKGLIIRKQRHEISDDDKRPTGETFYNSYYDYGIYIFGKNSGYVGEEGALISPNVSDPGGDPTSPSSSSTRIYGSNDINDTDDILTGGTTYLEKYYAGRKFKSLYYYAGDLPNSVYFVGGDIKYTITEKDGTDTTYPKLPGERILYNYPVVGDDLMFKIWPPPNEGSNPDFPASLKIEKLCLKKSPEFLTPGEQGDLIDGARGNNQCSGDNPNCVCYREDSGIDCQDSFESEKWGRWGLLGVAFIILLISMFTTFRGDNGMDKKQIFLLCLILLFTGGEVVNNLADFELHPSIRIFYYFLIWVGWGVWIWQMGDLNGGSYQLTAVMGVVMLFFSNLSIGLGRDSFENKLKSILKCGDESFWPWWGVLVSAPFIPLIFGSKFRPKLEKIRQSRDNGLSNGALGALVVWGFMGLYYFVILVAQSHPGSLRPFGIDEEEGVDTISSTWWNLFRDLLFFVFPIAGANFE
jgi:hypothetical protein